MIIDCIIDRYENEKRGDFEYNARQFYFDLMGYGRTGDNITRAMDGGTEDDTRRALCDYIDGNGYNPKIKDFINARKWSENQREKMPLVKIL